VSKKIKFVVIGCGHIGKRHAEMIQRNESCELVGLIDIKNADELGINHFNVPFFNSLNELLSSNFDFDILNVASPNGLHFEHALAAIRLKKHVVVEKPMALSKASAEKLIFEAFRERVQVFAVMQNRYSPPSVWIKDVLDQKILGEIFIVQLNCYWNRDERYYKEDSWHGSRLLDGGTLFTQFSHFIDIMY